MQIEPVSCIVVLCYLIGMVVKASNLRDKFIPVAVGLSGAVLGAAALYVMPEFPAGNVLEAMAVGVVSGLASIGVNQFTKQLKKEET